MVPLLLRSSEAPNDVLNASESYVIRFVGAQNLTGIPWADPIRLSLNKQVGP
jgi:hypothetical protein